MQQREQLEWQANELAALNFSFEEWQTLQSEHGRLANAASLLEAAHTGLEALSEGELACSLPAQLGDFASWSAGELRQWPKGCA